MTAINVELRLSDGSFASGMLRAGQSLSSFRKELERVDPHFRNLSNQARAAGTEVVASVNRMDMSQKSLLSTMRDISIVSTAMVMGFDMIVGSGGGLLSSIISVNAEMERLKFQMMGISSAANPIRDATASVDYLRAKVKEMPFSLKELATSFVRLKSTGTDPMAGSLQAIADGVAAFGGNDESLHRIVLGLTQISGKGVIQMEELRQQLGESMPNAMRIMARSMGVSVAELTKSISTGRVEASASLKLFYDELQRTYGGEAQRMMQTFSGQVSQLKANLQLLATSDGLQGFFEAQKKSLREINDFLSGDRAKAFADTLGRSLTDLISVFGYAAKTAYSLRREIIGLAEVFAGFVLLRTAVGTVTSLTTAFNLLRLSMAASAGSAREAFSMMALGINGLQTGQATMLSMQFAAKGLVGTLLALGSGFMALMPWFLAIGGAVYVLGNQFGWFKNQVKDAYDEMVQFGAKSAQEAESRSKDREQQLRDQIKRIEDLYKTTPGLGGMGGAGFVGMSSADKKNIEDIQAEIKRVIAARAEMMRVGAQNERETTLRDYDHKIEDQKYAGQRAYREAQVALDQQYEVEIKKRVEAKESTKAVDDKYRADTLANQLKLSDDTIRLYDSEVSTLKVRRANASDAEKANIDAMLSYLMQKRIEEADARRALGGFGIPLLPEVANQEKDFERGQKLLDSLTGDVDSLKASIAGSSGEYAKLMYRIKNGDFGSIEEGGKATEQLFEQLKAATLQKEALDKIMKGDQKAENDLKNIQMKNIEDRIALQEKLSGKTMTDSEKMLAKLNSGYYEGLGPIDNIRKAIEGLVGVTGIQGDASTQLGLVMRENTFGNDTVVRIDAVAQAVARVSQSVLTLNGFLDGTSFDALTNGLSGAQDGMSGFSGGILDLIASKEANPRDGYNTTLDNGRWTGGPKNLVTMTLDQIIALGDSMRTPENRNTYRDKDGNPAGSSALGRYQIVGQTLRGLMASMGLKGNELFSPEMQDRMAIELIKQRKGDPAGLQQEWAGLKNVTPEAIAAALQRDVNGVGPRRAVAAGLSEKDVPLSPVVADPAKQRDAAAAADEAASALSRAATLEKSAAVIAQAAAAKSEASKKQAADAESKLAANGMDVLEKQAAASRSVSLKRVEDEEKVAIAAAKVAEVKMDRAGRDMLILKDQGAQNRLNAAALELGIAQDAAKAASEKVRVVKEGLKQEAAEVTRANDQKVKGLQEYADRAKAVADADAKNAKEAAEIAAKATASRERAQAGVSSAAAASAASAVPPVYDRTKIQADLKTFEEERIARTAELTAELEKQKKIEDANLSVLDQNKRKTYLDDLIAKTAAASTDVDKLGKNYSALVEAIKSGQLGSDKDPSSRTYEKLIEAAMKLDAAEKQVAKTKEAMKQSDTERLDLDKKRAEINQQIADNNARIKDPNFEGQSSGLRQLNEMLDDYVLHVGIAYGKDSIEYKNALQEKKAALAGQLMSEATEKQIALADETRSIQESLMTQGQLRQTTMMRDLDRVNKWIAQARAAGMSEVEITRQAEEMKAAIRDKYAAQNNPVIPQMKEWKDLQGNLMEGTTKWLDDAASGVTGLITGTGDISSLAKGILSDVVNANIKSMFATSFGDKASSLAGSKFGGAGAATSGAKGGSKLSAGVRHTGGMANSHGVRRMVAPSMFTNAPRYHTGGIAGVVGSVPRLKAGEIPIVAKKREGIFTEEQMAALAPVQPASNSVVMNMPVTVNASGGTPEQNADLADNIARKLKDSVDGAVQEAIRKQSRPGGMLNRKM